MSVSQAVAPPPHPTTMCRTTRRDSPGRTDIESTPALYYPADSAIFCEGDDAIAYYRVVAGVVRTCRFLNDGRRQIDGFHFPGDVFGLEFGLLHRLSAEAMGGCTVMSFSRRAMEAGTAPPPVELLQHALRALERAQEHALLLGSRGAADKMAAFLIKMVERTSGGNHLVLPMSRQDIADYLGLTIETVSRCLSAFERAQVIAMPTARRINICNFAALVSLGAGEEAI